MGEDKDGGRKYLNILPIKSNYDNKKEAQILKTPIPHPSLHPGLNFTSKFSTSYSQETQGYQEWGLWLDHMLYLLLLTPQGEGGPLTLFCCSRVGPLPWETALHELPQHGAFPPAEFLMNCPSMSPFRTRLLQQGTPAEVLPASLLLCGSSLPVVWPGPAPEQASHVAKASFGPPPAPARLQGCFSHVSSFLSPGCYCAGLFSPPS